MIHNLPQYTVNRPAYVQYAGETGNTDKGTVIVTVLNQDGVTVGNPKTYTGTIGSNIGDITPNIPEGYKIKDITDNNNIVTNLPTKFSNIVQNITYHVIAQEGQIRYTLYLNGKLMSSNTVEGVIGTKANYSLPGADAPIKLTKVLFNGVEVKDPSIDYRPDFGHNKETVQYYYVTKTTPEVKPVDKNTTVKPADKNTEVKPADKNTTVKPADKNTEAKPADKNTTVKPADKNTEAKPADKNTTVKPEDKNTEAKPADKNTTVKPADKNTDTKTVNKNNEVNSTTKNDSNKTVKAVAHKESSVKELPHTGLGKSQDNAAKDAGILATILSAVLALGVFRKRK